MTNALSLAPASLPSVEDASLTLASPGKPFPSSDLFRPNPSLTLPSPEGRGT